MVRRLGLVVVVLGLVLVCVSALAAETQPIIILQGGGETPPVAYINETVDMALVLSWSNTVAWWAPGNDPELTKPDITYTISGFQHKVWLDPAKYKIGSWYKWDGTWESAGYNTAFEIKPGQRPAPAPTPATTPVVDNQTKELQFQLANQNTTNLMIARGDSVTYNFADSALPSNAGYGYLWLFNTNKYISEVPLDVSGNNSLYTHTFSADETQKLPAGKYSGYLQFVGYNKRQDLFINKKTGDIDSPYKAVPSFNMTGKTTVDVQNGFEQIKNNTEYCDDIFIPITIKVEDPILRFTDYYEENDNLVIHGLTSMSDGTEVKFVIDPERYVNPSELAKKTVKSTVTGNINKARTFSVTIPVDWDEMSISDDHMIIGSVDKGLIHINQEQKLSITMIVVNPTQTPIQKKVIGEEYGWHSTNTSNVSYIQNANGSIVTVPVVEDTPHIVYVTVLVTPSPTPTPLTMLPTPVPSTVLNPGGDVPIEDTPSDEDSPVSPVLPVAALGIIAAYALFRK
jgi:hypothetical protein